MVTPVTARGQETRARLLAAAEKVFGERNYFQVSIADITREAGTGNGTFYLYFPSKEAAFRELVQQRGHELRTVTHMAALNAPDRIEAERRGFEAFFAFIRDHPALYRVVRQAEFVDEEIFHEYYEVFAEGYRSAMQSAMERGEITPLDPEVVAYCLMGIGDFVGMRWVLWQEGGIPPHVFGEVMEFIRRGLTGQAAASTEGGGAEGT